MTSKVKTGLAAVVMLAACVPAARGQQQDGQRQLTGANVSATTHGLVIEADVRDAWDFANIQILVDADGNPKTGFSGAGNTPGGFDLMLEGGTLYRHQGADPAGWTWKEIGPAKRIVEGNGKHLRAEIDGAALGSGWGQATVLVRTMTADWQTVASSVPPKTLKLPKFVVTPTVPMAPARANRSLPPRDRFQQAKSYYCYYGGSQVPELSHYDIAILHVPAMTPENVKRLRDVGVVTVGYVSVGEDETLRDGNGKGPGGKASWYFDRDKDGQPDKNGIWNSWYANAADPNWRADRVAEAKRLVNNYGFDGIFLDTIEVPDLYPQSYAGMVQLVRELREALPDKVIVANRAFNLLKDIGPMVDGIMFESFTTSYDFDTKSYIRYLPQDLDSTKHTIEQRVLPAMNKTPTLRVLALDYCLPDQREWIQDDFDRAATFGFLPAVAPISLDRVYSTLDVKAKPDPKWLKDQVTPEKLSVRLDSARNGFAVGTVVQPSSCFAGYSAAAVVDGVKDRSTLSWSKANWASLETETPHELSFALPAPVRNKALKITWARDNKQWFPSRQYRVEVRSSADSGWQTVATEKDNRQNVVTYPLPNTPVTGIRIVQEPNGGSEARPLLMWVGQVELLDG